MSHRPLHLLITLALLPLALAACSVELDTGGNSQVVITIDDDGDASIGHEGTGAATYSTMSMDGRTELNLEASTFGGEEIVNVTGEAEADDTGTYRITLTVNAERTVELRVEGLQQVQIESAGQTLPNPAELSAGEHELSITGSR